jgi:hypothetical protein
VLAALAVALLTSVPVVRTGALLYAVAVLGFLVHDDPFGSNVLRLGLLVAAPVLLATAERRRLLVLAAAVGVLSWQVGPPWSDLTAPSSPSMTALRSELVELGAHRVEVVAPRDHRESSYVAEVVPLARGWARQQDYVLNPLFYKGDLTASAYLDWLHERAVDHVAVPLTARLDFGSTREGALLRSGVVPGLQPVWQDAEWAVFAVADPVPVARGLQSATRTSLRLTVEPGTVDVHVRWSRWLSVDGPACLERHGDELVLRVRRTGVVTIGSRLVPHGHCS